jgi:hypothetical protein
LNAGLEGLLHPQAAAGGCEWKGSIESWGKSVLLAKGRARTPARQPLGRRRYGGAPNNFMSNEELIRCFESDVLPGDSFHHADHVRLAFAYLCAYPVLQALEKFAGALKRFAAAREKAQLYNENITCAYFFLIRERMACCDGADWDEFARRNPDLLTWRDGVLSRYYREGTLQSDLAREVFVLPDRCFEPR